MSTADQGAKTKAPVAGQFLDRSQFRLIVVHQRGWGRSLPRGDLVANSVAEVVGDLEAVRERLGLGGWVVCGGSTGATLALAYATEHPHRCLGVVLRGLWCLGVRELAWNYESAGGKALFYPEEWAALQVTSSLRGLHRRAETLP